MNDSLSKKDENVAAMDSDNNLKDYEPNDRKKAKVLKFLLFVLPMLICVLCFVSVIVLSIVFISVHNNNDKPISDIDNYYDPRKSNASEYLFSVDFSMNETIFGCSGNVRADFYGMLEIEYSNATFNGSEWIQGDNDERFVQNTTSINLISFLVNGQYLYTFRYDVFMRPIEITLPGHKQLLLEWEDNDSSTILKVTAKDLLTHASLFVSANSTSHVAAELLYNETKLANTSEPLLKHLLCYHHTLELSESESKRRTNQLKNTVFQNPTSKDGQKESFNIPKMSSSRVKEEAYLNKKVKINPGDINLGLEAIMKPLKDGLKSFLPNIEITLEFETCGINLDDLKLLVRLGYEKGSESYIPIRSGSSYKIRLFASSYPLIRSLARIHKIVEDIKNRFSSLRSILSIAKLGTIEGQSEKVIETLKFVWLGPLGQSLKETADKGLEEVIELLIISSEVGLATTGAASKLPSLGVFSKLFNPWYSVIVGCAEFSLFCASHLEKYVIDAGKVPTFPFTAYLEYNYKGDTGKILLQKDINKAGEYIYHLTELKKKASLTSYYRNNEYVLEAKCMETTDRINLIAYIDVCFVQVTCCFGDLGCFSDSEDCSGYEFSEMISPNAESYFVSVPIVYAVPSFPNCYSNICEIVTITSQIVDIDNTVKDQSSVQIVVF